MTTQYEYIVVKYNPLKDERQKLSAKTWECIKELGWGIFNNIFW